MSKLLKNLQSAAKKDSTTKVSSYTVYPVKKEKYSLQFPLFYTFCAVIICGLLAYIYWGGQQKPGETLDEAQFRQPITQDPLSLNREIKSAEVIPAVIENRPSVAQTNPQEAAVEPEGKASLSVPYRAIKTYTEKIAEHVNERINKAQTKGKGITLAQLSNQAVAHLLARTAPRRNAWSKHITCSAPADQMNEDELLYLDEVYNILQNLHIEGVRLDGSSSRVLANGCAYTPNTWVSRSPRLKLVNITPKELIFSDEYEQEYRKEITADD